MILWECKSFDELNNADLYAILQLRIEVFVVEQNCPFQDCDDKDQASFHLTGWHENKLIAYTRIMPPGLSYPEASIGRVVTLSAARRKNIGKELMNRSIEKVYKLYSNVPIKIGAQLYLKKFYESFGFVQCSPVYLEDGINHIKMIKIPTQIQ